MFPSIIIMKMLFEMRQMLEKLCKIHPGERPVVVGVSGGPDSVYLLEILHRGGYPLMIAHLDHGLRPESGEERNFVKSLAERRGIPFTSKSVDAKHYADEQTLSIEEAARILRYRFLFQLAEEKNAQAVAVGHTADDQVETVLMHLLRGSGLAGLRGMAYHSLPNEWSDDIPLVRPLLGVWREQLLDELRVAQIDFVQDASNLETTYTRNRLRHELIPLLKTYNPAVKEAIWRMANILQEDYIFLEQQAEIAWKKSLVDAGTGYLGLSRRDFVKLPVSIQRTLIRKAIRQLLNTSRDADYALLERALKLIQGGDRGKRVDLVGGLTLELEGEHFWIKTREAELPAQAFPQLASDTPQPLAIPGEMRLTAGWRIYAKILGGKEGLLQAGTNNDPYQAYLDLERLQTPLVLRPRLPGDQISPLGMPEGHIKLSDLMINHKIPRRARRRWPILLSGEDVIWVPGCQISHTARVRKKTKRVVHLKLVREPTGNKGTNGLD